MDTLTLKVNGMTCGGCVRSVKKILEGVPGVRSAAVSLESGQAVLQLDSASGPDLIAALRTAIEEAGYEAPR